jgi:hypothetical protein
MKLIWLLMPVLLTACASRSNMEPNPNGVPAVQQSIAAARQTTDYIFLTGGINDGAAVGQTTTVVVTPDDEVVFTFQSVPVLQGDGALSTMTGHRVQVGESYAALSGILLPNEAVRGRV